MTGVEIGDLTGPVGSVDPKGVVRPADRPWVVEWGIGAEDRWHLAATEAAVRQTLLDDTPVPVTAMRVPGGDIVHRAAGVNDGSGRGISIEVENRSGTPVSLAFVVRPSGSAPVREVVVSERELTTDGCDALILDRPPGGSAAGDLHGVWPTVTDGPGPGGRSFFSRSGAAAGAVVVPLPHGQSVPVVVPVSGPPPSPVPASVAAAGWRAMADRAASVEVGDPVVVAEWRKHVPTLVLAAGSENLDRAARAACLLDRVGLSDEADRARASLLAALEEGTVPEAALGATALALASRRLLAGRPSGLADLAAHVVGSGLTEHEIEYVAGALDSEDERAASDVRRLEAVPDGAESRPIGLAGLIEALVSDSLHGIDLLPRPGPSWVSGPIDVRGLVTRHGTVSYSVRWHEDRPALLWQLGSPAPVRLKASGLDPSWSATAPEGEALLAPFVS